MVTLILLFWLLVSTRFTQGHDQLFQAMHDVVMRVYKDLVDAIEQPLDVYNMEIDNVIHSPGTVAILQNTSSRISILDTCDFLQSAVDISSKYNVPLSVFFGLWSQFTGEPQLATDVDIFKLSCENRGDLDSQGDTKMPSFSLSCVSYNMTLLDHENGTMTEAVTTEKCGGTTLRSLMTGNLSQFGHLKSTYLQAIPITQLTVKDFRHFPELESLILRNVPIAQMDNALLCYNVNVTILVYENSPGSLTKFPQQIFNCTASLKLEYFRLETHNIAYLPAHAFGSAEEQLKAVLLHNVGLEVIHADAFTGLVRVQFMSIKYNKLSQMPDTVLMPSSTDLHLMQITDDWYTEALNLSTIGVARQSQLKGFIWRSNISEVVGNFCSNISHSELQMIIFGGNNIETLPANIFDHCVSLEFLSITYNGLVYLPERLFPENVSRLKTLLLEGNRLNSNTSWSDVLMPLHELKYLNLSVNMLTSWTYNLSSLWNLEMLDLSQNSITRISHMAFMNMTELKFLSLECNKLSILTPEVQNTIARIGMMYLGCNNISRINMTTRNTEYMVTIYSRTLDVSRNNLVELDLPFIEECTPSCGKLSVFGDNSLLPLFYLPCSNAQQYGIISLTNNNLTDFPLIFPDVYVQQCSIEILNVSMNPFFYWGVLNSDSPLKIVTERAVNI